LGPNDEYKVAFPADFVGLDRAGPIKVDHAWLEDANQQIANAEIKTDLGAARPMIVFLNKFQESLFLTINDRPYKRQRSLFQIDSLTKLENGGFVTIGGTGSSSQFIVSILI